jgi:hypothetical protein
VGISASVFLIAIGAILAFAVTATVEGLDVVTVGWILMAVGVVGVIVSLLSWETWGGFGRSTYRRRVVVDDDPVYAGTRRRTVVERDDLIP